MKLIKYLVKTIHNIATLLGYFILSPHFLSYAQNLPAAANFGPKDFKKTAPYSLPLKTPDGARYCSSVAIKYKGKQRTLTNSHCCEYQFYEPGSVRIGDRLERILHISLEADVCVLTSAIKSPLKLSKSEFKLWEPSLTMGYPMGFNLTPRQGYVIILNEPVTVRYDGYVLTTPSNWVSSMTFPGNSGSPVFNKQGDVVNLIYAGPDPLFGYGITVPHRYLKNALEASLERK